MEERPTFLSRLKQYFDSALGWLTSRRKRVERSNYQVDVANVKENGWRQGSILDVNLVRELVDLELLPRFKADGIWVVISHDCDVTNRSLENEPSAEVLFGEMIDDTRKDGNRRWGKNSRLLQISDLNADYEFNAHHKSSFPRWYLTRHRPLQRPLLVETVKRLVAWFALRYNRRGFADEFNNRTRSAVKKLRRSLRKQGDLISGIYLFTSDNELPKDLDYEVVIWVAMTVEDYQDSDKRTVASKLLGTIESELDGCEGVSIESAELRSESQVAISDIRVMKRWDYDDLTLRDDGQDAVPPDA